MTFPLIAQTLSAQVQSLHTRQAVIPSVPKVLSPTDNVILRASKVLSLTNTVIPSALEFFSPTETVILSVAKDLSISPVAPRLPEAHS